MVLLAIGWAVLGYLLKNQSLAGEWQDGNAVAIIKGAYHDRSLNGELGHRFYSLIRDLLEPYQSQGCEVS